MEFQHLAGLGQQNLLPYGLEAGSLRQAGVSTARPPVKPAREGPSTSGGGQQSLLHLGLPASVVTRHLLSCVSLSLFLQDTSYWIKDPHYSRMTSSPLITHVAILFPDKVTF